MEKSVNNQNRQDSSEPCRLMVEGDGFEPSKSLTTDLQSAPFGHSGTPPCLLLKIWSW